MTFARKNGFDLHTFVTQSCLIDPQYDDRDMPVKLLPATKPGQLMYDNSVNAFELAKKFSSQPFYDGVVRDIHRVLTRGIQWYEAQCLSGNYRKEELTVGGHICPKYMFVDHLMRERWAPKVEEELASFDGTPEHALEIAWGIHHSFEFIHPFADGNGRTGRILLNYALMQMNQEPIVVWYAKRFEYYNSINEFNKNIGEYLGLGDGWPI
jgi:Fic family protein